MQKKIKKMMNKNSEFKKLFYIYFILDFTLIVCSIFVGLKFLFKLTNIFYVL